MPTPGELSVLRRLPGLNGWSARLERRCFPPLLSAPRIQGRWGEWKRMIQRIVGREDESLWYEANDWLMRTMKRECHRNSVTAVHSYEDCSLWQFEEAKRLSKACIYDLPIGYYPAWEASQKELAIVYQDWLPMRGLPSAAFVRPQQKKRELDLADLVLVPSTFAEKTIREFSPDKRVALARYGVDIEFWKPCETKMRCKEKLRFIYAGQISIRKGIPLLLEAWAKAGLKEACLDLVGTWQLAQERKHDLPRNVRHLGPSSREELRAHYRAADVFLFPSFFEGFGLVMLEAMACGLPVIASRASAGPDILDETCGQLIQPGNVDQLVEALRLFGSNWGRVAGLSRAARAKAETRTWEKYRKSVNDATAPLI